MRNILSIVLLTAAVPLVQAQRLPVSKYPLAAPGQVFPGLPTVAPPLNGFGNGFGNGYGFGYGYPYGNPYFFGPPGVVFARPTLLEAPRILPLQGAGGGLDAEVLMMVNARTTAKLTMTLPTAAEWTVNGVAVAGAEAERTLSSPEIALNSIHTFEVLARWKNKDGQEMEATKTIAVKAGERGKVTIYSGFQAKK